MNATGIIVEYNPLHNGHLYHINKSRELTGCDAIVAVMSGNFVQRGEPAFIDKFTRTRMALISGADLVLELPLIYSISSAEGFAFGGISLLNATGIINSVCFGSEAGSLEQLDKIADILNKEPEAYRLLLKDHIKSGMSYAASRESALREYASDAGFKIDESISSSNNILSIEYLKALKKTNSSIKPYTIKRIGSCYNQQSIEGSISSATAIRKSLESAMSAGCLPSYCISLISSLSKEGRGPVYMEDLSDIILFTLRSRSLSELSRLQDVNEGLEYRIKKASENCGCISEVVNQVKNKRYPETRIQRILLYALFNITKEAGLKVKCPPDYIRVLGFNSKGREALGHIKACCTIPVITNPSPKEEELMRYDLMSTDIYSLCFKNPYYRKARMDFKTPPVIL